MNDKKRLEYLDIARGIAMISIVLGHLGIRSFNKVVFTYHLPIFFIISGFFLSTRDSVGSFIRKKIRLLIIPYIVASIAIIASAVCMCLIFEKGAGLKEVLKRWGFAAVYGAGDTYQQPFYVQGIGAIWFLLATFWAVVMMRILLNYNKWIRLIMVAILFTAAIWTRQHFFWFPLSIQAGCTALLFVYIGYLIKESKDILSILPMEVMAAWTVFALVVWLSFVKDFQSFWLVHSDIGRGFVDIFGSLCGCYILVLISYGIERWFSLPGKVFGFLGKNSLIMLIVHIVEQNTFRWWTLIAKIFPNGLTDMQFTVVLILLKFAFIILATFILSKINIVRRLLGMPVVKKNVDAK